MKVRQHLGVVLLQRLQTGPVFLESGTALGQHVPLPHQAVLLSLTVVVDQIDAQSGSRAVYEEIPAGGDLPQGDGILNQGDEGVTGHAVMSIHHADIPRYRTPARPRLPQKEPCSCQHDQCEQQESGSAHRTQPKIFSATP